MNQTSEKKVRDSSAGISGLNKNSKDKRMSSIGNIDPDSSLSLSFVKNLQLSDEKESDQKSMATKNSNTNQPQTKLNPKDPFVQQVKEITDQVKSEHQNFLANLKEIL
jgi:hypothetical protein